MTKEQFRANSTATRRATRRAIAHGYASRWSPIVALMREIDTCPAMLALRKADAMLARVGSVGGADIGLEAYS